MFEKVSLQFFWQPRLGRAYLSPRVAFFVRLPAFDPPPLLTWPNFRILHVDSKAWLHLKRIIGQQNTQCSLTMRTVIP